MTGPMIDRKRAQALMASAGLDALILFQPENVATAAGVSPGVVGMFRRAGAGIMLIPADPAIPPAAVMPDVTAPMVAAGAPDLEVAYHPCWIDRDIVPPHGPDVAMVDLLGNRANPIRPSTFDARRALARLAALLAARGLSSGRLGADFSFVPAADLPLIEAALPDAAVVDGTDAIRRLRMVKTPREIALLRTAAELGEAGLYAAFDAAKAGMTPRDLGMAYGAGVEKAAAERGVVPSGHLSFISVGPDPWGAPKAAAEGDILRFDVAVLMSGYSSDYARTGVLGTPSRAARELHAALLAGLEAGLDRLKPGVPLADVHATMLATVQRAGVSGYARGHFGHSLGNEPFGEQWPFIAADSDVVAEPGMVLSVEAPLYVDGLGGFIVEDQVLVTETGIELMTKMDRGFRSCG